MGVFEKRELQKQSFFQRLLKKQPKENFIIELENLLSENEEDLTRIDLFKVSALTLSYKVRMETSFENERKELVAKYKRNLESEESVSEEEKNRLLYLKSLLCLPE
ncbi:MAG: hypothetical protein MJ185_02205 [Treponema sp.]|nr:hypothetical protein [Treponema sp.]